MRSPEFSTVFYALSVCGLAFGVYLVTAYSLVRILALYCLFNIILFWVASPHREGLLPMNPRNSKGALTCLAISVMVLLSILVVTSSASLYLRPPFVPLLLTTVVVLVAILAVPACVDLHNKQLFVRTRFLLPVLISIVLFVNFSIYLAQPNVFAKPLFETVDAYRDYVNAAVVLKLSGFRPEDMVFQKYYAAFPVVPIQISVVSLVGGLPITAAHMAIAVAAETLGVVCLWALSRAVFREVHPALAPSAGVLVVAVVWLQPYLVEPGFVLTPVRFSIPLVTLVLYLIYRSLARSAPPSRYVLVTILVLATAIVPMHATSAIFLVVVSLVTGLLVRGAVHRLSISAAVISLIFFVLYLVNSAGMPLTSMLVFVESIHAALAEIMSGGPAIVAQAALGSGAVAARLSELDRLMQALPLALVLSTCTVCVIRSWRPFVQDLQGRRLSSLHLAYGVLVVAGLGGGYLLSYFGVDMRYFAFPLTGLVLTSCAVVFGSVLRNVRISRMHGLILIGIMAIYAFSVASSPLILHETSSGYARLLPTESESAAAGFVSRSVQVEGSAPSQILTDFPFQSHVIGLTFSNRIGAQKSIRIVAGSPLEEGKQTIVILRRYFLEDMYLRTFVYYPNIKLLEDVEKWNSPHYNRIFDSYSARAYYTSSWSR